MISPLQDLRPHTAFDSLSHLSISKRLFDEVTWNSSFARSISVLFEELCYVKAAVAKIGMIRPLQYKLNQICCHKQHSTLSPMYSEQIWTLIWYLDFEQFFCAVNLSLVWRVKNTRFMLCRSSSSSYVILIQAERSYFIRDLFCSFWRKNHAILWTTMGWNPFWRHTWPERILRSKSSK